MHKRSILLVGNFLSSTLAVRGVCEELALRLSANQWSVQTTSPFPNRLTRLLDMMLTILRRRNQFNIAQVDVYSGRAFLLAETACFMLRLLGKPYVLTLHGGNLPDFAKGSPVRVSRLLQSAVAVTVPSEYLYERMADYFGQLILLPNPLDIKEYRFSLRKAIQPRMIWIRQFRSIYNPQLIPRFLALAAPRIPNARITLIGPDSDDGSLRETNELASRLMVRDKMDFYGPIEKSEVPNKLSGRDIFINTSNVDNTPLCVMEAMASGLCIVSTNVGGIPYLLEDEKEALLVPPDDPEAMANAVCRIAADKTLAEKLSANARLRAEQFDWSNVLPQWESLLNLTS